MHILYSGFDGLDLALKTSAPLEFVNLLETGKAFAAETQFDVRTVYNGVTIGIGPTGRQGGYAYTFNTGPEGAIWAVKRPKASDPWGVRIPGSSGHRFRKYPATHSDFIRPLIPEHPATL